MNNDDVTRMVEVPDSLLRQSEVNANPSPFAVQTPCVGVSSMGNTLFDGAQARAVGGEAEETVALQSPVLDELPRVQARQSTIDCLDADADLVSTPRHFCRRTFGARGGPHLARKVSRMGGLFLGVVLGAGAALWLFFPTDDAALNFPERLEQPKPDTLRPVVPLAPRIVAGEQADTNSRRPHKSDTGLSGALPTSASLRVPVASESTSAARREGSESSSKEKRDAFSAIERGECAVAAQLYRTLSATEHGERAKFWEAFSRGAASTCTQDPSALKLRMPSGSRP